jgi:V8-like Glu-specific endopeptidase
MSDSLAEQFTDEDVGRAVFKIYGQRPGTCFLVKDGWHLLTARHVVFSGSEAAKEIKVQVGPTYVCAQVSQEFKDLDVALLKLDQEIKAKPFALAKNVPHDEFRAAGYPVQVQGFWHAGNVSGPVNNRPGVYQLTFDVKYQGQLSGLSGAPVLDKENSVTAIITNHYLTESSFG